LNDEKFWKKIQSELQKGSNVVLVEIMERKGSAPNAEGAKMYVTLEKSEGTVGGGLSEYQLIEQAREKLRKKDFTTEKVFMVHSEKGGENKSGMVCSGTQTFAIVPLGEKDKSKVQTIIDAYNKAEPTIITINEKGIKIELGKTSEEQYSFIDEEEKWTFKENIGLRNRLIIVGGGHVSLAFSKIMKTLDFHITVYDNRENLETMKNNNYANVKKVIDYEEIGKYVLEGNNVYVTIMSFGHKYDELVLEKLIHKKFKYIGLMASKSKKKKLFENLKQKGISDELLEKVHSPIGISINSITPEEIAISIAAEIVATKNAEKKK